MEYSINELADTWYFSVNGIDNANKYQTQFSYVKPTATWVYLTFTYDPELGEDGLAMFVNGVEQTPTLVKTDGTYSGMSSSTAKFNLFDPEWSSIYNMDGRLDGFSVWDVGLNARQVKLIYDKAVLGELIP
jgi:hypothetical protein